MSPAFLFAARITEAFSETMFTVLVPPRGDGQAGGLMGGGAYQMSWE